MPAAQLVLIFNPAFLTIIVSSTGELQAERIDDRNLERHGSRINLNRDQPRPNFFKRTCSKC